MWEMDFLIFKIDADIKEEARPHGMKRKKKINGASEGAKEARFDCVVDEAKGER